MDSCSFGSFDLSALMPEQARAPEGKMFHNYWGCKMRDPFPSPISHPKASRNMSCRRSYVLTLDRAVVESEFAIRQIFGHAYCSKLPLGFSRLGNGKGH